MTQNITRRRFLHGSATLAAAAAFSTEMNGSDSSGSKEFPVHLGVASYSFRKFGPSDVIPFMKRLGTPYLNLKDIHLPFNPASDVGPLSEKYRAAGMQLTAAGVIYFTKDDDADMRAKFNYVKAAGIPQIVAGPTPETLPRLESFAKEYDVTIAIHNHGPEDKYFPSPLEAMKAVKGMDRRMGICVDVGHAARAGADVPAVIREVGPRLYDVHMKDLRYADGKWTQVAVGDGDLPVPKIFAALGAVKYAGYVDLEYEIDESDPMPGMIKSFAYMRGATAGMKLNS